MGLSTSKTQRVGAGALRWVAASVAPAGWLECNGATISRTAYAALFAAIGTTYGAGDGATTFVVPDLRDDFVRGASASRPVGTRATDSTRSHTHGFTGGTSAITYPGAATGGLGGGGLYGPTGAGQIAYAGDAETAPRHVAMLACIKY